MKRPWADEDRQRLSEAQDDSGAATVADDGLRRLDGLLGASEAIPEPDDGPTVPPVW
jgi:hypothetical protein